MSRPNALTQTNVGTTQADTIVSASPSTAPIRDSVKDTGRVHVGGMMIRFNNVRDNGRVHVGGMMMKF